MSFSAQTLFNLLPAILRIRDQAQAVVTPGWLADPADRDALKTLQALPAASLTQAQQAHLSQLQSAAMAGPLANLIAVIAEQVALLEEDLDQLYDDQFIETCAGWVVPYIGDLIGYRMPHSSIPGVSPRAEVAHTIAYRRRKGTVVVLEQLAHDVTAWNAKAVEYFSKLVMTQYVNHPRPQCLAAPDLRRWEPLERIGGAFDSIMHTVDVRRIASGRGRYNIPNVGLFLWRIDAQPLNASPAVPAIPGEAHRYRFHPLNIDQPLLTSPQTEASVTQLATPLNVPEPISRRVLDQRLSDYYSSAGAARSLCLYTGSGSNFTAVDPAKIVVCNLSDQGAGWAHAPASGQYKIDPVLGRLWLPPDVPAGTTARVDFNYGFGAQLGGGPYERTASFEVNGDTPLLKVPQAYPTLAAAVAAIPTPSAQNPFSAVVIEIGDNGRYQETFSLQAPNGVLVELRAADDCRPTLVLGGPLELGGGTQSGISLNGLLITGNSKSCVLHVAKTGNSLSTLSIAHCTLVPGWALNPDCSPQFAGAPSLVIEQIGLAVTIRSSITGPIFSANWPDNTVSITDSIVDALATSGVAYGGLSGDAAGDDPGAALTLSCCTMIGKLHARALPLVSNSILLAALGSNDPWKAPVIAVRRQQGCIRFSWLPSAARVPRRYECLPESAASPRDAVPRFTSLTYGFTAYGQLSTRSGAALLTGADDESQPGAFHGVYPPQREINLRTRLDEYLRVGLEAGIFYQS